MQDETGANLLHYPPYEEISQAKRAIHGEANELIGGLLLIKFHSDELTMDRVGSAPA